MRKNYDFTDAKPVEKIPALARAQAGNAGKERITIRLDADVLAWFRAQVQGGGNYQTLINDVLRAHLEDQEGALERTLRRVIREELHKAA
ncbi:BrnA antitoxin family protein [Luteimonas sp. MJ293]|uniref:BrnA antitoxin family protein n=1 Tax=Luteimonas sp. MJ146 TaxID=3129240 RepID=UPI0031BAA8DE